MKNMKVKDNWNKPYNKPYEQTEDYIDRMSKAMDELCELLSADYEEFKEEEFFQQFSSYIENNSNRLLYTSVTNAIFNNYDSTGTFQTNLEKVIIFSNNNVPKKPQEIKEHERVQRALMKLWDHINLAVRQYELFNKNDEHYSLIAEEKMKNVEIRLTKEMNMQLISLIAIFTALSFIVFGGISSLDNIFLGVKDIPVTKLIIVGTIWCFCIMNLVYVFMFFIGKLTGLSIKSASKADANIVQQYPLIWWCNWVLVVILALSSWAYYIKCEGFSNEIHMILSQHPTIYFIIGTIVILVLAFCIGIKIYLFSKRN